MRDALDPPAASPALITALWRSVLPTPNEVRAARRRLHAKALVILALVLGSYWALVISDLNVLIRMAAAGVLAVSLVAVGTSVMHEANHGSFSSHEWLNRVLAYTSDALGASSWLWRIQHNNLHHGNTNVVGYDADLELAPFARLAPAQPWKPWYRAQHFYIWPLYGFMALKNLLVSDLLTVVTRRMGHQPLRRPVRPRVLARITAGKLFHLGWAVVIPLLFNRWWAVLCFYVACSWMVGFVLAIIFQLAHCVDGVEVGTDDADRRGDDFAAQQLRTTADVACGIPVVGHVFRFVAGGLNHQIEHHLAPRLPHTLYPGIAERFRRACADHEVTYHLHPGIWAALRSHARWLRTMSRPATVT